MWVERQEWVGWCGEQYQPIRDVLDYAVVLALAGCVLGWLLDLAETRAAWQSSRSSSSTLFHSHTYTTYTDAMCVLGAAARITLCALSRCCCTHRVHFQLGPPFHRVDLNFKARATACSFNPAFSLKWQFVFDVFYSHDNTPPRLDLLILPPSRSANAHILYLELPVCFMSLSRPDGPYWEC